MKRILFQGDSITSARRYPEDRNFRGSGYATMVSGKLGYEYPGEYEFINMGVGGDRITELMARSKSDIIHLAPDYLSILIGINDAWLDVAYQNGVSAERFELLYNLLIQDITVALPHIKIILLEPFVLQVPTNQEHWNAFYRETKKRAEATKRVAERNGLVFIPLQQRFEEAAAKAPAEYWLFDGIHPTAAGHELVKRAWMEGFCLLEKT